MLKAAAVAVAVLVVVAVQSVFVMHEWQQGLVTQFGRPVRTVQEPGLFVKLPFAQTVTRFDRRVLATDLQPGEYLTLDKKRVVVDHVSRWRIADPLQFFRSVRDESGARARLDDIIIGQLRQEIAKHRFIDFIRERREDIMATVTAGTREMATPYGVEVVDVRIKRADLPPEVQNSVFDRMRAERQRIAKRYRAEGEEQGRLIRADADKEREIILARAYQESQRLFGDGDAEATTIFAEAYGKAPEFYSFLRRLEAYERILHERTTILLRPDTDVLRFLRGPGPTNAEPAR
jgi:membrane protease subunit HflC